MAQGKRQDITTGSGLYGEKTPILAKEKESDLMAEELKQSPHSASIAAGSTKPLSIPEAVSSLQTICLDLRALKCQTVILARNNVLTIAILAPASIEFTVENGHVQMNGVPVSFIESENK